MLTRRGFVTAQPQKRPKSTWHRFTAAQPNERWQADITQTRRTFTAAEVRTGFRTAFKRYGLPARVLTDNAAVFTGKPRRGGQVALEADLVTLRIRFDHSRPYHPQTCGTETSIWSCAPSASGGFTGAAGSGRGGNTAAPRGDGRLAGGRVEAATHGRVHQLQSDQRLRPDRGELDHARQWIRAADDFERRYGNPHLYTTCRTYLGAILFASGNSDARGARAAGGVGYRGLRRAGRCAPRAGQLAQLRLAEVGSEEAEGGC